MVQVNISSNIQKTVTRLLAEVSTRNRDVISRRFGLKSDRKETLESIGKSYGITRERVRQIEEFTLGQLAKFSGDEEVHRYVGTARDILTRHGGVVRESDLFMDVTGIEKAGGANAGLVFILTLNRELVRVHENDDFHSFWALSRDHVGGFTATVAALIRSFDQEKKVLPETDVYAFAKAQQVPSFGSSDLSKDHVAVCLAVSKSLSRNIYGEVGLSKWAEIRPKGVRDKAYLILKKGAEPKHFSEIARVINVSNFSPRRANIQTVHNELIKDSRFVLVGRGTYALSEWGYKSGTVKDVLVDILKGSQKPLTKAQLVAKVLDARIVKENTILLNLQDAKTFARQEDGTYMLREV